MTTVVVVTFNSGELIGACLDALRGVSTIVVDNASGDGTLEIVRAGYPEVRIVARVRNGGYAVAVNEGARLAGANDVLVLNPDVVIQPGSIATLEAYLQRHPRVGIVAPRLVYPTGSVQSSVRTFPSPMTMLARRSRFGRTRLGRSLLTRHLLEQEVPQAARPVHWALGAAMLVRRRAINEVGGMDQRIFLYGEDLDWCYRMWNGGWEVHIEPAAAMVHRYERMSRNTMDFRSAATRHHWASICKLYGLHPSLLIGRGPKSADAAIRRWAARTVSP